MAQHVLVVDDDADVLSILVEMLRESGFIVTAADGAVAMRDILAAKGGLAIDAVVLDCQMPGEPSAQLALHAKGLRLPVVMISGSIEAMEFADKNALQLLWKPFRIAELLDAIEKAIGSGEFGQRDAGSSSRVRCGPLPLALWHQLRVSDFDSAAFQILDNVIEVSGHQFKLALDLGMADRPRQPACPLSLPAIISCLIHDPETTARCGTVPDCLNRHIGHSWLAQLPECRETPNGSRKKRPLVPSGAVSRRRALRTPRRRGRSRTPPESVGSDPQNSRLMA